MVVALLLATALGAYTYGRSQSPAVLEEQDRDSLTLYAEALDTVRAQSATPSLTQTTAPARDRAPAATASAAGRSTSSR